jgi:uncharacterized protein (DUF433 family)
VFLIGLCARVSTGYADEVDYSKIIAIEPGKRSGKPCIRGTRMTVTDVLEYLAGGMTHQELLADFPDLTEEDIRACLALPLIGSASSRRFRREVALRPEFIAEPAGMDRRVVSRQQAGREV